LGKNFLFGTVEVTPPRDFLIVELFEPPFFHSRANNRTTILSESSLFELAIGQNKKSFDLLRLDVHKKHNFNERQIIECTTGLRFEIAIQLCNVNFNERCTVFYWN
jgi:hypothetical protein